MPKRCQELAAITLTAIRCANSIIIQKQPGILRLSSVVYDDKGKQLKNLPAPGKTDDPELSKTAKDAWKSLKKQLKTVATNQKLRLEQALSTQRYWDTDHWKELFVKNPVMRQFAIGLIWGVYEDKNLLNTFRHMEDGTFNTVDEEEYILPEDISLKFRKNKERVSLFRPTLSMVTLKKVAINNKKYIARIC